MSFRHGIYFRELATALQPMISATTACVVVGTAPLFNASNPAAANEPVLCQNMADFVERFGFSDDFDKYTLCEAAYCFFTLYNIAPVVFINVLDAATHKKAGTKTVTLTRNRATVSAPILLSTLVVKSGETTLTKNDYAAEYSNEQLTITIKTASKVTGNALQLTYDEIDASKVTKADVIGGVDGQGNETGLELISAIYPKFAMVPGIILAPKFSTDSEVAAVLAAKCLDINGVFKCVTYIDIDTTAIRNYADCNEHKNNNNLVDAPFNKRLIQAIVNSVNIWLNGLTARECILGGRIDFLDAENPTTNLIDGHITFHCFIGFCVPAEQIEFLLEFDTSYFGTLFG